MLGSQCSSCCGVCGCKKGKLPYTMTVTFSGLENKTHGNYCDLVIASDVGGGAAGVATAPGGCDGDSDPVCCEVGTTGAGECNEEPTCGESNRGPLTGVLLTEPGSGYAVYRSPPTLEAGGGSGEDAEFSIELKSTKCVWSVKAISVKGGSGYIDGEAISITANDGDTVITPAKATLATWRGEPTLKVEVGSGSGAELEVAYTKSDGPPVTYAVSGVTVISGGAGYTNGSSVSLVPQKNDAVVYDANATVTTNQIEPTLSASVAYGSGTGALLSVEVAPYGDYWTAASVSILEGGAGYSQWDFVSIGGPGYGGYGYISAVDENGAITAVAVYYGGYFTGEDGGIIQSVDVWYGGSYYKDTGVPSQVSVTEPGKYYRIDPNAEPCAPVTVTPCGGGGEAVISAAVDLDKNSSTFGQVTGLTIDNGGGGYLAWRWIETCRENLNGIPYVLKATTPENLISLEIKSCFGSGAAASVVPLGVRTQPDLCITGTGTGGSISPSISQSGNEDGNSWKPYWSVDSVSASGGFGYTNNEQGKVDYRGGTVSSPYADMVKVTLQSTGVTEEDPPNAKNDGVLTGATVVNAGKFYVQHEYDGTPGPIKEVKLDSSGSGYARLGRQQPIITITGNGSGATFTPTLKAKQDSCKLDYWEVESLSVSGGGSGYTDSSSLTFYVAGVDKSDSPASATVYTREKPTVKAEAAFTAGTGASFSVTLTKSESLPRTWGVSSVDVINGGTKYQPSVPITFAVDAPGTKVIDAVATASANESGVITSVSVGSGGSYYLDNGKAIESRVARGGVYYRENKSLAPYTQDVTVIVNQVFPSEGKGAVITPTVDTNTNSGTFGKITKLTIENGGSDYQILGGPLDCRYTGPCGISLQFNGNGKMAYLTIDDAVFRTNQVLDDCANLPSSASVWHSIGEGIATISPGGAWDDKVVCPCKNSNCTPTNSTAANQGVTTLPCGESPSCPPCTGYCDPCNKCGYGCGCIDGKCEPCSGPYDDEHPCPEGCMSVDGECVKPCLCSYQSCADDFTATATVTVTFPGGNEALGHCKGGQYSATFELSPGHPYCLSGQQNVEIGDGRTICLRCFVLCDGSGNVYDGKYFSFATFSTYPCGDIYWQCYWSCYPEEAGGLGGGFIGTATAGFLHDPQYITKENGRRVCIPKSGGGSFGGGVETPWQCMGIEYSLEITPK